MIIITGASSGIGRAIALEAARRGMKISLHGRDGERLQAVAEQCRRLGAEAIITQGDVSEKQACMALVENTATRYGRIDILINNAGMSMRAIFAETDPEVLRRLMEVNFWGAVYCTHIAMPHLLASKGSVVGISSIAGFKGLPGRTGYSASKFALNGFLETLRIENLYTGLHVLICAPGFTSSNIRNTALNAKGNEQKETPRDEAAMMQPEEVATRLLDAVHKRKNTLILTMQGKLTVLLNKFFPRFIDRMAFKTMAAEPDSPLKKP